MAKNVNVNQSRVGFMQSPKKQLRRNRFDMGGEHVSTFQSGALIPFCVEETLPGDLWQLKSEIMLRFLPLYWPIMSRMDLSVRYFYVPNRIMFQESRTANWESFITNKEELEWPHCALLNGGGGNSFLRETDLGAYLGLPQSGIVNIFDDQEVSAYPAAAYAMIWDYYYRNQFLQDEIFENLVQGHNSWVSDLMFQAPLRANWNADYFTSARPMAQAGEDVLIPLLNTGGGFGEHVLKFLYDNGSQPGGITNFTLNNGQPHNNSTADDYYVDRDFFNEQAASMQDFREAAQMLEFLELTNRIGTRYGDYMRGRFGVDPNPGQINEPQYLGGSKGRVVISDVMSNSETLDSNNDVSNVVGDYAGQAMALQTARGLKYFAKEHGFIIGMMCVKPRSQYYNGLHRKWSRKTYLDYAHEEFAHIGDQEIKNKELYWDYLTSVNDNEETFGYTRRYEEYRHGQDTVAGKMRTDFENYHLGRKFTQTTALNSSFLQCLPRINDVFATIGENDHEIFGNVYNDNQVYRALPKHGIPKL